MAAVFCAVFITYFVGAVQKQRHYAIVEKRRTPPPLSSTLIAVYAILLA
jgi:hypothetical protein